MAMIQEDMEIASSKFAGVFYVAIEMDHQVLVVFFNFTPKTCTKVNSFGRSFPVAKTA